MNAPADQFTFAEAKREQVPLLIGLMGPSGGGKSFSALRLATGIQSVVGGDIFAVDTEARRLLHYADRFKFRHLEFKAPFNPARYLAAIKSAVDAGAKVVIVDSMSHEHEGPGGVLEMHAAEMQRMGGQDSKKFLAWQKPKSERRAMINGILQMNASFVFCFRAKEKIKIVAGKPIPQGFMPQAGEEFVFEMTANCLLLPHANGVPTWRSDEVGERLMMKLPEQFKALFAESRPLDEDTGASLAKWARGDVAKETAIINAIDLGDLSIHTREAALMGTAALEAFWSGLTKPAKAALKPSMERFKELAAQHDTPAEEPADADVI